MCRFVAYIGTPVLADDLLYKPKNSLVIAQTMNAEEMSVTVNGDGFGLGWYAPEIDNEPCVFRGIKPAWSDMNLRSIAKKIVSPLIFGHIRAASPGMFVEEVNSHPFSHGKLMFMHNGMLGGFKDIRRQMLRELNDVAYDAVHGATDSEHMFGLYLNYIRDPFGPVTCEEMVEAMNKMLQHLNDLLMESNVRMHSYLNLVVTNGTSIVATRYTTNPSVQPSSLYYMYGKQYVCNGDQCIMEPAFSKPTAIVIASEPFTARRGDWMKVERNSMMIVDETMKIRFQNIELPLEKMEFEAVQTV